MHRSLVPLHTPWRLRAPCVDYPGKSLKTPSTGGLAKVGRRSGSKFEADRPIDKYGKRGGGCIDLEIAEDARYELGYAPS
jgi:hypothetical protein